MVNGGYKIEPIIYKSDNNKKEKKKILSSNTSKKINKLIQRIVYEGTGKYALVDGISVGGKTGTSRKAEKGSYSEKK